MPKRSYRHEPGLAWAYVRERAADKASAPFPELGPDATRLLPTDEGDLEPHRLAPVTAWAHLKPRARPLSYCPVCLDPVTLKLGQQLRHHYAHPPESTCRAATPEGALHLAAKLHLARELHDGGNELLLDRLCHRIPGDRSTLRCSPAPLRTLSISWDEVQIERSLPSLRADLLLLRSGVPVLAVEVYASHGMDDEKGEKYRSLGVPWLEVSARRVTPEAGPAWRAGGPLPVLGDSALHPARWRCPRHEALFQAYLDHERTGVHRLAWRIVHLYRTDGGRSASEVKTDVLLLWMVERREEGRVVEAWLERDDRDGPLATPERVDGRDEARVRLHRRFLDWARWTRDERGAVMDSPMPWMDAAPPPPAERARLFPQRLRIDAHAGSFVGAPGLPRLGWPAPQLESAEQHPLFGCAPVYWSDLPLRDQGPVLNAVVDNCWLTLRLHHWTAAGGTLSCARADFALFHHDGRRWTELHHAAFSREWEGGALLPDSRDVLRVTAAAAAEHATAIARRRTSLQTLAEPLLERLPPAGSPGDAGRVPLGALMRGRRP